VGADGAHGRAEGLQQRAGGGEGADVVPAGGDELDAAGGARRGTFHTGMEVAGLPLALKTAVKAP
jgi:hypothetical protein